MGGGREVDSGRYSGFRLDIIAKLLMSFSVAHFISKVYVILALLVS